MDISNHPAVTLGNWLRKQRIAAGYNARVFAGRLLLSPAEYAEVESGVVKWVGERQHLLIITILRLPQHIENQFSGMLNTAKAAAPLRFSDIFSRKQLAPVRLCKPDGKQITREESEAILEAVFTELTPIS